MHIDANAAGGLGARGLPAFASQIAGSDVFKVLDAVIDRRSALQANAIALSILGEWKGRVMTLRMIAAEDEIDKLLEHAFGLLPIMNILQLDRSKFSRREPPYIPPQGDRFPVVL